MKAIPSSRKKAPDSEEISLEGIQESISPDQYEENITEGGEYLDDAIRMKDQPLDETTKKETD